MTNVKPTCDEVRALLDYSSSTGVFVWKRRGNRQWDEKNAGNVAGSLHNGGYRQISINHQKYLAHHLAWLIVHGEWPTSFIDHINLDKRDNRISNLRLATPLENSLNTSLRKDNTSGHRGVFFEKRRRKWIVLATLNGRRRQFGSFSDKESAVQASARVMTDIYDQFCPMYIRDIA